ncbi:pol, partial [Symbiodinium necroappetens]
MPPSQKPTGQAVAKPQKGKGKGSETESQTSKIEFALPPAMVTSLQAITSRSTQDLWGNPTSIPGDLSVEQQAQRRASAVGKLSKRISGNLRAKDELRASLQQWVITIAIHLAGLVQRVRALGEKVDMDLTEALREMRDALHQQPSITTSEQVSAATEAVGRPIWSQLQEHEIFRVVSALRAFGVVEAPQRGMEAGSEVSFGLATAAMPSPEGMDTELGGPSDLGLPVGARSVPEAGPLTGAEVVGGLRAATGRPLDASVIPGGTTPEALQRPQQTQVVDSSEPAHPDLGGMSWEAAWLQLLQFATEHGSALVGEVIRDPQQDMVLPLQDQTPEDRSEILEAAEDTWLAMLAALDIQEPGAVHTLCVRMQDLLSRLRMCPSAVSGVRQGIILLAQVTLGNLLDPYSYAPTTAQEWLFPTAIAEHGSLARGALLSCRSRKMDSQTNFGVSWSAVTGAVGGSAWATYLYRISGVQIWQQGTFGLSERPMRLSLSRPSGWFHPTARLLLLAYGDAFQAEEDDAPATLEDRFSTSLSLPTTGELAFHDLSGANAVILHAHGHTYACVPSYADHLTLRSSALSAVAADLQIQPRGRLWCARLLPPLDRMPAIQFVAAYCEVGEVLGVVDLRPSDGGVHVIQVREGATPAERIAEAVQQHGEPSGGTPLAAGLAQGLLQVLHREHVVDPFAPLNAAPPAPVVVLWRRSHLASGYRDPQLPGEDTEVHAEVTLGAAIVRGAAPSSATRSFGCCTWGPLLGLLLAVPRWLPLLTIPYIVSCMHEHEAAVEVFQPMGDSPWSVVVQHPGLASAEEHATLGRSLPSIDARTTLCLSVDDRAGVPEFRFCIWSPGDRTCFFLPGASKPVILRERLLEAKVRLSRGDCLVWDPLPADRGLHFVATAQDPALVTVIADTGREHLCLDVPRVRFGTALLSAVQLLCPERCFRITENVRTPVRHGDVIRLFDEPIASCRTPQFYVPRFTYPPSLEPGTQLVYIASVDMGLIRLKVPWGVDIHALERALIVWLGRQRCLGVRLHKLDLDVSVPVYCLPRRGRSTLAVGLLDLADPIMDTIVHVVDADESVELDCEILREPWRTASLFWNDILEREPVCVACWHSTPVDSAGGPRFRMVALGLDVCRALGAGWQPPVPSVVPDYDLVIAAEHLGISWGSGLLAASRHASTQTVATHWPMRASPLFSSAMPVPRRAEGCSFDEKYGAEGTLFHLECSHMHVRCTVPCVAGRHIWALRFCNWVRAACTTRLSWDEVLEVAGLSYCDLPGTSIHGPDQLWSWPEDVVSLSGQCGHVMHSGSGPYLECIYSADPRPPPTPAARSHGHRLALSWWQLPFLAIVTRGHALYGGASLLLALTTAHAASDTNASDTPSALHSSSESEGLAAMTNSTPSCSSAWCHELSCQSTHFTVNSASLAEYFTAFSPTEPVRVQLWNPFEGPSLFDFLRTESATALHSKLLAAGHDPSRRVLYVAFDTQSTVVDLVSVPPNSGRWWIVRDGLSRELLRPVTTWVDENRRSVVTLNSRGQAASLATTPETVALYHLPQGARGATAAPFTRVYGHMTTAGIALVEAGIGVVSGARPRLSLIAGTLMLFAVPSQAMMQGQVVPTSSQALWSNAQPPPQHTRIWTHTLAAPVTVAYSPEPNPARLAAAVAATQRGPRGDGVFDWTVPRQYGDTAHIIHYPAGLCPPFVFWLLHYRGRGAVICATPGHVDWQYLAQEASEAFSSPGFMQGSFGIQHNGRIFAYGSDLVTPPHGTILHLVRMGARASSGSAGNVWEAPAELHWIPQFEYNLCLGPGGEAPICDGLPGNRAAPGSGEELQASLSYMQHLLGGLEQSVEQCHAAAVALATSHSATDSVPATANGEGPPASSASSASPSYGANYVVQMCFVLVLGIGQQNLAGLLVYGLASFAVSFMRTILATKHLMAL